MAVNIVKNVALGASRLLGTGKSAVGRVGITEIRHPRLQQSQRGLTRSLWYLSATQSGPREVITRPVKHTKMCGCCGLHTTGDKHMVEFLEQEIDLEKKASKSPKKIRGFEMTSDGAEVTLTKQTDNETVTVKFNVNDAVEDESEFDYDGNDENQPEPQMVARPMFTVEINKGGGMTLGITCMFSQADLEVPQEQPEREYTDLIEIQEIAMLKGSDWTEKVYTVSGNNMDGNLYDLMLNMLEERGVTGDFLDEMVEFSTAYEHNKYVDLLEQLKQFAGGK